MTDRPILFSSPMIRALLDGRKIQTRRVINAQPMLPSDFNPVPMNADDRRWPISPGYTIISNKPHPPEKWVERHVRYTVGDRLWVRESIDKMCDSPEDKVCYMADWQGDARGLGWRPSIHMPRWASRLTLTVTDVRVQRLQEISEADAVAEGCFKGKASGRVFENEISMHLGGDQWANARDWYADLWDQLNETRGFGWDANPWVVAVTFTVERRNIDEVKP